MKTQAKMKATGGSAEAQRVLDAFRRWGYLQANLDSLGFLEPVAHPELDVEHEIVEQARRWYCGTLAAEFVHIPDPERRRWIEERIETEAPAPDRQRILARLVRADLFEQVLQARYLGTKRFSLEGMTALVPLLDEVMDTAAEAGAEEIVLAMSHRGRLNVMVHAVGKSPAEIFAGFEDVDPRSVLGGGDVKYHRGATGTFRAKNGKEIAVRLVSNPSHLEAVDPVAVGRVRAKQRRMGEGAERRVVPVVMHGDAAFAGQGITAETLNLAGLEAYDVGGTVHIIVNNLIGFTTVPRELHATRWASDLAKRLPIPILHVNGEDPDAVVRVGRMAMEYRTTFGSDVVVNLVGYRRHGHSEVDDPTTTQPKLYKKIAAHALLWKSYAERIGADADAAAAKAKEEFDAALGKAAEMKKIPQLSSLPAYWDGFFGGRYKAEYEVDTGLSAEVLREVSEAVTRTPAGFHVHAKVQRLLEERGKMGRGEKAVDYGMAETLAFGTLLREGVPVRMSGQDARRGTFNQRHALLVDAETEQEWMPLQHVAADKTLLRQGSGGQAWCEIYNSTLSEAAVMGFEFGFSRDFPEALVLWEAQFGDFANGAQVIIDQFVAASEDKWKLLSGLVLLLPHGHEGQGPEHTSGRIERFLQSCARDNMQVAQPSTAAQYFHLLRRQALRKWRKPLVVFTPKSMLRHPAASSPIEELTRARFENVIGDAEVTGAERVLIATGKIVHELRAERKKRGDGTTAIVALEQMYPFPEKELTEELARHPGVREIVWVQEEPANMGALFFVRPRLQRLAGEMPVRSVKRAASSSPATGSAKAHELEQKTLLTLAFETGKN